MSYERQVATIASWVEGLSSDNYPLTSCQPRKIELPVMRTEACSGSLIDSQGCVGVVGARSTLCKVHDNPHPEYSTWKILIETINFALN